MACENSGSLGTTRLLKVKCEHAGQCDGNLQYGRHHIQPQTKHTQIHTSKRRRVSSARDRMCQKMWVHRPDTNFPVRDAGGQEGGLPSQHSDDTQNHLNKVIWFTVSMNVIKKHRHRMRTSTDTDLHEWTGCDCELCTQQIWTSEITAITLQRPSDPPVHIRYGSSLHPGSYASQSASAYICSSCKEPTIVQTDMFVSLSCSSQLESDE